MKARNGMMVGVGLAGMLVMSPGVGAMTPGDIQVVKGTCEAGSHTAEGPLGSDLSKRQSRFFCDTAVITFFDDYKGHVIVQFAQKQAQHMPLLAFGGTVEADGIKMTVDRVYFTEGQATVVDFGKCQFFFKNRHMSGIFCGITVDEAGRRTTAVVSFVSAPGQ